MDLGICLTPRSVSGMAVFHHRVNLHGRRGMLANWICLNKFDGMRLEEVASLTLYAARATVFTEPTSP